MNTIRKAKNTFIYTADGQKYYDLSANSNIIGHSHRLLTTLPKNALSSSWNIRGTSIYHNRFRRLIRDCFGDQYELRCAASLTEFWLRMSNAGIKLQLLKDTASYLESHSVRIPHYDDGTAITEAAAEYIYGGDILHSETEILNGWWYPEPDMPLGNAKLVILPELFSGFTPTVFVLIRKDCAALYSFLDNIEDIASFPLISAVSLCHTIRNQQNKNFPICRIGCKYAEQRGRIFRVKGDTAAIADSLAGKHIIINTSPPYYSYLPINLEHYQIKYISKAFNENY